MITASPRLVVAAGTLRRLRMYWGAEAAAHAKTVLPAIKKAEKSGASSLREIAGALNDSDIATARGGRWHAQTVANVKARV